MVQGFFIENILTFKLCSYMVSTSHILSRKNIKLLITKQIKKTTLSLIGFQPLITASDFKKLSKFCIKAPLGAKYG
jgi:hypothetical protein